MTQMHSSIRFALCLHLGENLGGTMSLILGFATVPAFILGVALLAKTATAFEGLLIVIASV